MPWSIVEANMRNVWMVVTIIAAMISVVVSSVKETHSAPVASGCAGVSLFVFLWFIAFVIPKLEDR